MAAPARVIHLYTPGLVAALTFEEAAAVSLPPLPGTERLLGRARAQSTDAAPDIQLFNAFQQYPEMGTAALEYLGDGGEPAADCWLRADPVYLQADQDRMLLFPAESLALERDEVAQLRSEFNRHFEDRGWILETPVPERWYLRLPGPTRFRGTAVHEALGRDVNALLPEGQEGRPWRAALNEAQMLLHASAVNAARAARGVRPVNSVWFWGAGELPAPFQSALAQVHSDSPLARGLAMRSDTPLAPVPPDFHAWAKAAQPGAHLVATETLSRAHRYGDMHRWLQEVERLEQCWIVPALRALARGEVSALHWWPGGSASFMVDRGALRKFWRRPRALVLTPAAGSVT